MQYSQAIKNSDKTIEFDLVFIIPRARPAFSRAGKPVIIENTFIS
jgi:hypothetical protein